MAPCAWLTCSILLDLPLSMICICIKCPNLFNKTSLHSNFPNNLFHIKKPYFMQFSVSACESCMLHCVLLDCNGIKCTGNGLSIPVAAERNKLRTGCYFFAYLVFSPHDMNVFVTDLTANNVVTHMQGFSSGFWWFSLRNCVRYEQILINVWLPYTIN